MTDHETPFELLRARSAFEARVIVSVLQEAGISAHTEGGSLQDEFAISQQLMNTAAVKVFVPESQVAAARDAIKAAREIGERMDDDFDVEVGSEGEAEAYSGEGPALAMADESEGNGFPWIATLFFLLAVIFAGLWLKDRIRVARAMDADPVFTSEMSEESGVWVLRYWRRATGKLVSESFDADGNGIYERVHTYDVAGLLVEKIYDENENGDYERSELFDREGRRKMEIQDEDRDGRTDLVNVLYEGGARVVWRDLDRDGVLERRELHDPAGKVVSRHDDLGAGGIVPVD